MRIVTINMWGPSGPWQQRWSLAARLLQALEPDVVCVQEAVPDVHLLGFPVVAFDKESALAVLTRLPTVSNRLQVLGQSPLEDTPRKAIWVEFNGWHLANTHLAWRKQDGDSRHMQATALAAAAQFPLVLCGDLNAEWHRPEMEPIRALRLTDADPGRPTWDNRNPHTLPHRNEYPDARIDHIGTDVPIEDVRLILDEPDENGLYPSDHFGVMATISI